MAKITKVEQTLPTIKEKKKDTPPMPAFQWNQSA